MRRLTPEPIPDRPAGAERGATLVFVAVFLAAMVGVASLVVDLGNGWLVRRSLVSATDSAALAAAQRVIEGHSSQSECNATAADFVGANTPGAVVAPCELVIYDEARGRVTVTATDDVETWFAGALGEGDFPTSSTSTVAWGPPASVVGLRPIALCLDSSIELATAVAYGSADDSIVIPYNKADPDDCGESPGNWAFVDYDGVYDNANPGPDVRDWLYNGYPGQVRAGSHPVTSCLFEAHCYDAHPGSLDISNLYWPVDYLEDNLIWFWMPVYDYMDDGYYHDHLHVSAIVRVQLLDFRVTGDLNYRFLKIRVEPGVVSGTCCGDAGAAAGTRVTVICGVDPEATAACDALLSGGP